MEVKEEPLKLPLEGGWLLSRGHQERVKKFPRGQNFPEKNWKIFQSKFLENCFLNKIVKKRNNFFQEKLTLQ